MPKEYADYFNVSYGLAATSLTTGNLAITTTEAAYYGITIVAGATTTASITVYDAVNTGTGKVLDRFNVRAQDSRLNERYNPVQARYGIYIVATGTGMTGTLFFGPKG